MVTVEMLTRKLLTEINTRPQGRPRWPFVALGTVAAALAALLLLSKVIALAVLAAGAGGVWLVYRRERAGRAVSLAYDLDVETGARFVAIQEACGSLAGSERVWLVGQRGGAKTGVAATSERRRVEVGRPETPGIRANVAVWGVDAEELKVLFFPECVLLYRHGQYRAVSYESFEVSLSFVRFAEEEEVPADADVVGRTWRFPREDGGPDRRYAPNPQLPLVLYGLLRLTGPSGLDVRLQVSNRAAAARFAHAFGAKAQERAREERSRNGTSGFEGRKEARASAQEGESASAAASALGLKDGASNGEITAAYRNLARIYHPDKVANLPPEIREFADYKMKEINAAYAQLKRRGK